MDLIILITIGLLMGLLGGLLGIGGSVVMIPAMTLAFGENQHLYQASAMILNFFVAGASFLAHHQNKVLDYAVLRAMIPAALTGIVLGVFISNGPLFAGERSFVLARVFGAYLLYVAVFNLLKLRKKACSTESTTDQDASYSHAKGQIAMIGGLTGLGAGLLGMGAGTVATPMQQILLKMPLRRAMSHSSTLIVSMAWLGAIVKNVTLGRHHVAFSLFADQPAWLISIRIAAYLVPTAMIGGWIGGHLMHRLPRNIVRVVFIVVLFLSAVKLLTVKAH